MKNRLWLLGVILLLLALWFGKRGGGAGDETEVAANHAATKSNNARSSAGSTASKSSNGITLLHNPIEPSPNFPESSTHEVTDLKKFFIPELKLENATLRDALQELLQQYRDICLLTNQTPLEFDIHLPPGLETRRDIHLKGRSLVSLLASLAAGYGIVLDRNGTSMTFTPFGDLPLAKENGMQRRQWLIGSDLEADLRRLLTLDDGEPSDPFVGESEVPDLLVTLLRFGLFREEMAEVESLSENGAMIARMSVDDATRLDRLIEEIHFEEDNALAVSLRILVSDHELDLRGTYFPVISREDVDAQLESADLGGWSSPLMFISSGQQGTFENIREVTTRNPDGSFTTDWVGLTTRVEPTRYGFGYRNSVDIEARADDGTTELPENLAGLGSFHETLDDVAPGGHLLVQHHVREDGQHVYLVSDFRVVINGEDPVAAYQRFAQDSF